MASTKAGIVILLWGVSFLSSIVLAPFYPIAGGFAIGAIVTAAALVLTVKWSIEEMLTDTFSGIEEMQKQLQENHEPIMEQMQEE